jgi:hypothetical protein
MAMQRQDCLDVGAVTPVALGGAVPSGATVRALAAEQKTGGQHFVLELPAGWSCPRGFNRAAVDWYVLEGAVQFGDEEFTTGCYTYLPAGMAYGPLRCTARARLLVFTDRPFDFVPSETSTDDVLTARHIPRVDTWRRPWVDPMKDIVKKSTWVDPRTGQQARPPGVLTKALRKDDGTKEVVALTVLSPGFVDPGTEHHPHNECLYLIAGDCYIGLTYDHRREDVKEDLVLHKDFYIGRPPGIRHGPVCTQNGAFWLIYLADHYTGIYQDVDDWEKRVGNYFASAAFR